MPFFGLGLHVLVALYFAAHAVRTGQDRYWLMVLFAFPGLGSLVYALTIWLPQARHAPEVRAATKGVQRVLDPDRELRFAQEDFDTTPTTAHRVRLGDALLAKGRADEAAMHFEKAAVGVHADDPDIRVKLAEAWLACGRAREAREQLDDVIRKHPQYQSPRGHLAYARAVAAEGDRSKARDEFDTLTGYSGDLDVHAEYAATLAGWGDHAHAREVCEKALHRIKRMPAYQRRMYRDATSRMKKLLAETR
ncbi:tetratricopeptide repeat protein [Lysobacter claricitrinus]|uniref:tetratricopeptide repeat protein n=1 Tax=Lysobacter claricitrinus TaxID=3367728 RepID=UPI0037DAF424